MSLLRAVNLFVIATSVIFNLVDVTAQTSGNPPCYFCDGDPTATLSNPKGLVPIPPELAGGSGITEISCEDLLSAGKAGFIPPDACVTATATDELKKGCGCSNYVPPPVAAPLAVPAPLPITPVSAPVALPPTEDTPISSPTPTSEPLLPTTKEPTDATTPTISKGSMTSKEGKKETKPPKEGRNKGSKTPKETTPKEGKNIDSKAPKEPKAKKESNAAKEAPEEKVPKQPKKNALRVAAPSLSGIEQPSSSPVPSSLNR